PLTQQTGFGPNGSMGFFQYVGWCTQNAPQCVGLGVDTAISIIEQAWHQGYNDFSAAMSIALYSHVGIQGQAQLNDLSTANTGETVSQLANHTQIVRQ